MRWPIRSQILVPFACLLVLSLLAMSTLGAYFAVEQSQRQIQGQLRQIARTLEQASFPLNDAVLSQMHGLSGAQYRVLGSRGAVLASSSAALHNVPSAARAVADWRDLQLASTVEIDGASYLQMALVLRPGVAAEGRTLEILYPERVWRDAVKQAAYPFLTVGAVTLAAAAAIALVISSRLSRPLLLVSQELRRVTAGGFRPLPLPRRDDELRDLVRSINQMAEQLEEMRRTIRRTERFALLGQLSGGIAHHLRNDVTGARMAVQLHQRECSSETECLEVALRQMTMAEQHLKSLLSAGQPETLQRMDCNLDEIVQSSLSLVEPTAKHRKVDVSFDCGCGEYRECTDGAYRTLADAEQLRHVLLNLLLNAIEAAGPGGRVTVELSHADERYLVRVRDNGKGVPHELLDKLFEAFTTSKPEGVGLGLTVGRQIAVAHGGDLSYSRVDGETCFTLELPIELSRASLSVVAQHAPEGPAA